VRILLANDGVGDAGGVQSYLAAVAAGLSSRGHELALLHLDAVHAGTPTFLPAGAPRFGIDAMGPDAALAAALAWGPDVAFVHNMRPLEVDRMLLDAVPVAKMMHGYFGTCVSGQKAHLLPSAVPCARPLGAACLALYAPRRCGRLRPGYVARQWRWAREQRRLIPRYGAIVVASGHMRREYLRNGAPAARTVEIPLFPTVDGEPAPPPARFAILFLGRMTTVKGGDLLVRAVARASAALGRDLPLTLAGDGPQRSSWASLARRLGVDATFTGWVDDEARPALFRSASLLAVPSVWPEPFGLVGLEAGVFGVPAVAFDVGGIGAWLRDGENGWLVPGDPPRMEALADALARAATEPAALAGLRTGARAVAERLSADVHLERLETVLAAVAARSPVPAA
jgi:glycosyltransferase involved in cell wall biosynthesis